MALPACTRCGTRDPQLMHGLMSLWFGPLVELEADLGYFHLCPSCHDEVIVPELERIQNRILELHPAAQRHLDDMEEMEPAAVGLAGGTKPRDVPVAADEDDAADGDDAAADGDTPDADGDDAAADKDRVPDGDKPPA